VTHPRHVSSQVASAPDRTTPPGFGRARIGPRASRSEVSGSQVYSVDGFHETRTSRRIANQADEERVSVNQ